MSATKYQIFLKTVECGSFTKAAEELNFSQSGISHAISSLEEELGVTLLSRNRGGVTLTGDGRALLPQIQQLCDEAIANHTASPTATAGSASISAPLITMPRAIDTAIDVRVFIVA